MRLLQKRRNDDDAEEPRILAEFQELFAHEMKDAPHRLTPTWRALRKGHCARLLNEALHVRPTHHIWYFDWELDGPEHRRRLEQLFGTSDLPVLYARGERALVHEVDRLRRICREQALGYRRCRLLTQNRVASGSDSRPDSEPVRRRLGCLAGGA